MVNICVSVVQCSQTNHKEQVWDCHWPLLVFWEPQSGPSESSVFVFPLRNLWLVWLQLQWSFCVVIHDGESRIFNRHLRWANVPMWIKPDNNTENSWPRGSKTSVENDSGFRKLTFLASARGINHVIIWPGKLRLIWVWGFWRIYLFTSFT